MGDWINVVARKARKSPYSRSDRVLHPTENEIKKFLETYKVHPCPDQDERHDWRICQGYHHEDDRRRNPYQEFYLAEECNNHCERHYHPELFRTQLCKNIECCAYGDQFCSHAHDSVQLRSQQDARQYINTPIATSEPHLKPRLDSFLTLERNYREECDAHWTQHHESPNRFALDLTPQQTFLLRNSKPLRENMERCAFDQGMSSVEFIVWERGVTPQLVYRAMEINMDMTVARSLSLLCPPSNNFATKERSFASGRCIEIARQLADHIASSTLAHNMHHVDYEETNHRVTVTALPSHTQSAKSFVESFFERIDLTLHEKELNEFVECGCCLSEFNRDQGVCCSEGHFYCSIADASCFSEAIKSQILNLSTRAVEDDSLRCPECNTSYPDSDLTNHLSTEVWTRIKKIRIEAHVIKHTTELQNGFQLKLEEKVNEIVATYGSADEQLRLNAKRQASEARNMVLNLYCPHCKTAYLEFTGCMALQCSSCRGHFCGYCHAACSTGQGAHQHVRECLMNETVDGSYYADETTIKDAQRRYRTRELKKFLRKNKKDLQNAIVVELKRDLKNLGIDQKALFEVGDLRPREEHHLEL